MGDLPDFNLFGFSFADLTSGEEVETFTEECSYLKMAWFSQSHKLFFIAFRFLN